ncbi:hypothetical protein [Granulicella tundricola]|uniref:Uncharacterized protein n=1 Tax=Granulicella tundricola (strain ATCC BAA-1859 / DSM 23138 / MP5ACTX9) TaxID=1198114 RepID=E8WWU9_GRATM|nr:hypothetical protein [Granulicella tundricola]ADW67427.1 hypothetical protein AciX9_0355 [Granulicella tundricola MP5ACTX9]
MCPILAYEAGPLHFGMTCNLADLATGRKLTTVDCYTASKESLPAWANALQQEP